MTSETSTLNNLNQLLCYLVLAFSLFCLAPVFIIFSLSVATIVPVMGTLLKREINGSLFDVVLCLEVCLLFFLHCININMLIHKQNK